MYTDLFIQLGLAKNEARIYETLLTEGESAVGQISKKSKVYRRNVYDSLNRLVEKGLVFEILNAKENRYQAVEPSKLSEMIQEKQTALNRVMPNLESLYQSTPHQNEVYILKGIEGWKNVMRHMLRLKEDVYVIAGKGVWVSPKLKNYVEQFVRHAKDEGIKFHSLFDYSVKSKNTAAFTLLGDDYRVLSKESATNAAIHVFGNYCVFYHGLKEGEFNEDDSLTVIINQDIADAFRVWFKLLWSTASDYSK